jgi:carboxypeptidase PM20D1
MKIKVKSNIIIILFLLFHYSVYSQEKTETNIVLNGNSTNLDNILSKYLQFKSISGFEKKAGEFLKKLCVENGLQITSMGVENGNYNFAASIRPLSEELPNIIFLHHIDVVPPGDTTKWSYPPFSGEITEKEIWGRGAFDNKGAGIMQLGSVIELKSMFQNSKIPYNVTFLAVSCEETQCEGGVKYVIDNFFKQLNPVVVIGEGPPALSGVLSSDPKADVFGISVAHKRAFWVELENTVITSGHGSVTPINYANKNMVKSLNRLTKKKEKAIFNELNISILKQLGRLEKGVMGFVLLHPRLFKSIIVPKLRKQPEMFSLFSNTITLTSINSNNNVVNIVPNKSSALLDCRLLPLESRDEFLIHLKKRLRNDSIRITVIHEMPEMQPSDGESIYFNHLKSVILEKYPESHVIKVLVPNFNDVGVFRSKGVQGLSSIPIKLDMSYLESIHNLNERIPKGILNDGKSVYVQFVKKCMQNVTEK